MNISKIFFFIGLACLPILIDSKIKIVCTAALIQDNYEQRKEEYIRTLTKLKEFGYETYVFESCTQGPTFLRQYCDHVCYTQTNNPLISNKGVNEARSMVVGFMHYNFESRRYDT